MPILNNMYGSGNSSGDSEWINSDISTGIAEPFITPQYSGAFDVSLFGSVSSCITSASLWTTDNQSSIEVVAKEYETIYVKYFNGTAYDYKKNFSAVKGNVIWYGGTNGENRGDTKRGFMFIAGLNNEIIRYDIDTKTSTVEVAGDTTLFNGIKGQVFCVPDIENNSFIFGTVYINTNNYCTIRSINTSKTHSWSDASAVVDYYNFNIGDRYIDGAPIYDYQNNMVSCIGRYKTQQPGTSDLAILFIKFDPVTQQVLDVDRYNAGIEDVFFKSFQITAVTSISYPSFPKTDELISYLFNATSGRVISTSSLELTWYRGYLGLTGTPKAIYEGDANTFIYTYGCHKNTDNRTYQDGGMVVKLSDNQTYNGGDSPIFSTLRYFMYNEMFNNEDMMWINCNKNDILYLQPVTNIFIITNGTDSLYSDMLDFKIVEISQVTIGKRYYEYKVEEECMICCDKHKIYSLISSKNNG